MERLIFINDYFNDDGEIINWFEVSRIPRVVLTRTDLLYSFDDNKFFKRFRLTKETVIQVLQLIEDKLEFPNDKNNCVSPINQLLMTLRLYATGNHLLSISDFGGIHVSTMSRITVRVSKAIAALKSNFINLPSTLQEIRHSQNEFYKIASFPRVIGAIDGTHVKIQSPGGTDAEIFRNRKGYMSINVQAICDYNLKCMNVVARWPGSTHDVTIFNSSTIKQSFESQMFNNSILLGDSGYAAKPYLFTPLLNPTSHAEQLYNESHIRTRNIVERFFGVLKRRFPILAYGCRLKIKTILNIIVATMVLHNLARQNNELELPPNENINEEEIQRLISLGDVFQINNTESRGGQNVQNSGHQARANLIHNYFANLN